MPMMSQSIDSYQGRAATEIAHEFTTRIWQVQYKMDSSEEERFKALQNILKLKEHGFLDEAEYNARRIQIIDRYWLRNIYSTNLS